MSFHKFKGYKAGKGDVFFYIDPHKVAAITPDMSPMFTIIYTPGAQFTVYGKTEDVVKTVEKARSIEQSPVHST